MAHMDTASFIVAPLVPLRRRAHGTLQACAAATTSPHEPGRKLSEESRAKISTALKGRRISASHRDKISQSLMGDKNPRYGRRLSAETRARIGAAVAAASQRRREAKAATPPVEPINMAKETALGLEMLRKKAIVSPLLTGAPSNRLVDRSEEHREVERLLRRVRNGQSPPESVSKMKVKNSQIAGHIRTRIRKKDRQCDGCVGAGTVACCSCVGTFGTVSQRCGACLGAGVVFCEKCQGAGVRR